MRLSRSTLASAASSSTTRMRFFIIGIRHRNNKADGGADVHLAVDGKRAAMVSDDALGDREAEAAAARARAASAEKPPHHLMEFVGWNTDPLVADGDAYD